LRSAPPRRRGRPRPPPARQHPRGRATPGWGRRAAGNSPTSCVRACGTSPRRPSSPQQTARRAAAPPLAGRRASAEAGHSCCSQMRRRAPGGLGRETAPPVSGIFRARPLGCRAWEVVAAMSPPAGSSCEGVQVGAEGRCCFATLGGASTLGAAACSRPRTRRRVALSWRSKACNTAIITNEGNLTQPDCAKEGWC